MCVSVSVCARLFLHFLCPSAWVLLWQCSSVLAFHSYLKNGAPLAAAKLILRIRRVAGAWAVEKRGSVRGARMQIILRARSLAFKVD